MAVRPHCLQVGGACSEENRALLAPPQTLTVTVIHFSSIHSITSYIQATCCMPSVVWALWRWWAARQMLVWPARWHAISAVKKNWAGREASAWKTSGQRPHQVRWQASQGPEEASVRKAAASRRLRGTSLSSPTLLT